MTQCMLCYAMLWMGTARCHVTAKENGVQLPLARVRKIIKSDPDVKLISSDSTFLIAKSTVCVTLFWCCQLDLTRSI
jgi:hypothetical protein